MKFHLRIPCCLLLLTLGLAACGNKGPLYLPDQAAPHSGEAIDELKKRQR